MYPYIYPSIHPWDKLHYLSGLGTDTVVHCDRVPTCFWTVSASVSVIVSKMLFISLTLLYKAFLVRLSLLIALDETFYWNHAAFTHCLMQKKYIIMNELNKEIKETRVCARYFNCFQNDQREEYNYHSHKLTVVLMALKRLGCVPRDYKSTYLSVIFSSEIWHWLWPLSRRYWAPEEDL